MSLHEGEPKSFDEWFFQHPAKGEITNSARETLRQAWNASRNEGAVTLKLIPPDLLDGMSCQFTEVGPDEHSFDLFVMTGVRMHDTICGACLAQRFKLIPEAHQV